MKQFKITYWINGEETHSIYFLFTASEVKRALKKMLPEARIVSVEVVP